MQSGGHRSWSGAGIVEATPGDVICVNPGEVHDGTSIDGCIRGWQMLYVDAKVVEQAIGTDIRSGVEIARPVIQDTFLARKITLLFAIRLVRVRRAPDPLSCQPVRSTRNRQADRQRKVAASDQISEAPA